MVGILLVNKWEIHKGEALKVRKVLDFWLMSKKGQTLTSNSSVTLSCEGQFCMTMTYPCEIYHTAKGDISYFFDAQAQFSAITSIRKLLLNMILLF